MNGHRRCTYILPATFPSTLLIDKALSQGTHACWCSSWKLKDGKWQIWRRKRWERPQRGELTTRSI